MPTLRRLAVTLFIPLFLLLAADRLPLPGVGADVLEKAGASRESYGVFALGITPIVSGYWIVELVALLVPRWSRLRHGDPAGRAKLERAAMVLSIVLAAVQAFSLASLLQNTDAETGNVVDRLSLPVIIASLLGGVCVQLLAARLLSRHGLVNGLIALWGAGMVRALGTSLEGRWVDPTGAPREHLVNALALVTATAVSWVALRGAGSASVGDGAGGETTASPAAPYRDARGLAVHPWIPLPSSSAQAYLAGSSLLVLAVTWGATKPLSDDANLVALVILTGVVMVLLAHLLHRPAEMADLASRLGAEDARQIRGEARAALNATLMPSFLFFLTLILVGRAATVGVLSVVILTPIAMDLVHALRVSSAAGSFVPVWEERRASAVPVLRAALAADGIATRVSGMAVLSFWQAFVPYAPAQILVKEDDRERATSALRRLLVGGEPSVPREAPAASTPVIAVPAAPWSLGRRTIALGACFVAAGAVLFLARLPQAPTGGPVARAELEIVRVDDTVDPFAAFDDASLPAGQGIGIYAETAPLGPGKTVTTHFARIVFRPGETPGAAIARVKPWLSTVALPRDVRFGFEPVDEVDADTQKVTHVGVRTFVLSGPTVLRTADVTAASAMVHPDALDEMYVAVTLSPEAGQRFEELTRAWTKRRLAILVDGVISSAPVVQTAITGGHVSITVPSGDDVEQRIETVKRLARGLGGG
jgi:hypothetical protein